MGQDARVRIERLAAGDGELLREMTFQSIHVPAGGNPPERSILDHPEVRLYFEGWGRPGDRGFKALAGEQPIGAAWLRMWHPDERGYGWVDYGTPELSIGVLVGFRGQGLGTKLLEALLAEEPSAISLSVTKTNPAIRLYERFGFLRVDDNKKTLTMVRQGAA